MQKQTHSLVTGIFAEILLTIIFPPMFLMSIKYILRSAQNSGAHLDLVLQLIPTESQLTLILSSLLLVATFLGSSLGKNRYDATSSLLVTRITSAYSFLTNIATLTVMIVNALAWVSLLFSYPPKDESLHYGDITSIVILSLLISLVVNYTRFTSVFLHDLRLKKLSEYLSNYRQQLENRANTLFTEKYRWEEWIERFLSEPLSATYPAVVNTLGILWLRMKVITGYFIFQIIRLAILILFFIVASLLNVDGQAIVATILIYFCHFLVDWLILSHQTQSTRKDASINKVRNTAIFWIWFALALLLDSFIIFVIITLIGWPSSSYACLLALFHLYQLCTLRQQKPGVAPVYDQSRKVRRLIRMGCHVITNLRSLRDNWLQLEFLLDLIDYWNLYNTYSHEVLEFQPWVGTSPPGT